LNKKGINFFPFTANVKRVVSGVGLMKNRYALYFEVPELEELKRISRPKREHFRDTLGFLDFFVYDKIKIISIQEIQSDIIDKLPAKTREKYSSFQELGILSVAKFANARGIEGITLSSAELIKNIWPSSSQKILKRNYEEVPRKMGFKLMLTPKEIHGFDFAFGEGMLGKSNVHWEISIKQLKKEYPEFFKE
jgi:hypothetical protein